jgi:protein-S-isoprenylcysteine O-methyltransferase Ste14
MFAQPPRSEASAESMLSQDDAGNPLGTRIHLSALIAGASYATGAAIALMTSPAMAHELADGGTGAYVQLFTFVGFILAIAVMQRQMGIALSANRTTTPDALCTTGAFKYSRNPIYLAFIGPLAALGYFSPIAAGIAIVLYVLAMTRFVIRGEERALTAKFGTAFKSYCRQTPRWI